ncbi:MAG: hypothetical protein ACXWXL_03335 [Candidatus Binatia bacterium]
MTQLLNMDGLKKGPARILTLNGNQHTAKELSVSDFIKINDLTDQYQTKVKNGEMSSDLGLIHYMIDVALVYFPTCAREQLFELSFEKLEIIAKYARDGAIPDELMNDEGVEKK